MKYVKPLMNHQQPNDFQIKTFTHEKIKRINILNHLCRHEHCFN